MTAHGIELDSAGVRQFCRKWHVRELSVFGSILRDDFRPDSDVDFLVVFTSSKDPDFLGISRMEEELGSLIGRSVHVVERSCIEKSPNYIRRRHILATAERLYAQG